ncbi:MAG: alpha/beta hydrolase [Candidatus Protochlamydia sp.]|nr:alpha/beta hydrolase [Candidatus Protochlamydia sp.]
MKNFFYKFLFFSFFFIIGFVCLNIILSSFLLDQAEEEYYKEGKKFWEWPSSYGPINLHYVEKGEGPNHILLIHGFRLHTYTWRHLIYPLSKAGYHVWALDLAGYGLSDKPQHASYNPEFFLKQIEDFLTAKNISSVHIIGNSMGGGLALNFVLDHPEKVKSLVLISPLGYPLDLPFYLSFTRHLGPLWTPFLGTIGVRQGLKGVLFDSKSVTEEQVAAYALPYRFSGGSTASLLTLKQFDKERLVRLSKEYPSIENPALIIWGDDDQLIPIDHFHQFNADFPNSECLLVNYCGHLPHEEKPEIVLEAIFKFLKNLL